MMEVLAAHKLELEIELRERIQDFFQANSNEAIESVSIEMKLAGSRKSDGLSTIHILVKNARSGPTLITI